MKCTQTPLQVLDYGTNMFIQYLLRQYYKFRSFPALSLDIYDFAHLLYDEYPVLNCPESKAPHHS